MAYSQAWASLLSTRVASGSHWYYSIWYAHCQSKRSLTIIVNRSAIAWVQFKCKTTGEPFGNGTGLFLYSSYTNRARRKNRYRLRVRLHYLREPTCIRKDRCFTVALQMFICECIRLEAYGNIILIRYLYSKEIKANIYTYLQTQSYMYKSVMLFVDGGNPWQCDERECDLLCTCGKFYAIRYFSHQD